MHSAPPSPLLRPVRSLRRAVACAVAVLVGIGTALPAHGATPADPDAPGLSTSARLAALVARIKHEQAGTRSLDARFVQRKASQLLLAPDEARGRFLFAAPDRIRWEYETPKPILVLIRGKDMLTWYRDLGRADAVRIGRYTEQVFKYLGAGGSIETLYEYFRVSVHFPRQPGEPYRLELVPKYERIAKKLRAMTVWVDRASFLPTRFRYLEADGDSTEYELHQVQRNTPLPPGIFEEKLPASVQVRKVDLEKATGP